MKTNNVVFTPLLLWLGVAYPLSAQQSDASKRFEEIKFRAEKGDAVAQHNLGVCYSKGDGVTTNLVEAVNWYRKAAEQAYGPAQSNLGICYQKGKGVEMNMVEAAKWYHKAAEQGLPDPRVILALAKLALAQQMTPEQIAKGFRLARDFKPSRALESGISAPTH